MKKRFFSLILALAMMVTALPGMGGMLSAAAEDTKIIAFDAQTLYDRYQELNPGNNSNHYQFMLDHGFTVNSSQCYHTNAVIQSEAARTLGIPAITCDMRQEKTFALSGTFDFTKDTEINPSPAAIGSDGVYAVDIDFAQLFSYGDPETNRCQFILKGTGGTDNVIAVVEFEPSDTITVQNADGTEGTQKLDLAMIPAGAGYLRLNVDMVNKTVAAWAMPYDGADSVGTHPALEDCTLLNMMEFQDKAVTQMTAMEVWASNNIKRAPQSHGVYNLTITKIGDAALAETALRYDTQNPADVTAQLTLGGHTLQGVLLDGEPLEAGTDYTVTDGTVTISQNVLSALEAKDYTITFDVDTGADPTATLTVEAAQEPEPEREVLWSLDAEAVYDMFAQTYDATLDPKGGTNGNNHNRNIGHFGLTNLNGDRAYISNAIIVNNDDSLNQKAVNLNMKANGTGVVGTFDLANRYTQTLEDDPDHDGLKKIVSQKQPLTLSNGQFVIDMDLAVRAGDFQYELKGAAAEGETTLATVQFKSDGTVTLTDAADGQSLQLTSGTLTPAYLRLAVDFGARTVSAAVAAKDAVTDARPALSDCTNLGTVSFDAGIKSLTKLDVVVNDAVSMSTFYRISVSKEAVQEAPEEETVWSVDAKPMYEASEAEGAHADRKEHEVAARYGVIAEHAGCYDQNSLLVNNSQSLNKEAITFNIRKPLNDYTRAGYFDFTHEDEPDGGAPVAMAGGVYAVNVDFAQLANPDASAKIQYVLRGTADGAEQDLAKVTFDGDTDTITLLSADGSAQEVSFPLVMDSTPTPGYLRLVVDLRGHSVSAYVSAYTGADEIGTHPAQEQCTALGTVAFDSGVTQLTKMEVWGLNTASAYNCNIHAVYALSVTKVDTGDEPEPEPETYTVTANAADGNMGSAQVVTEGGPFEAGASVQVLASANAGYQFTGWSAEGITLTSGQQTQNPVTIEMPAENVTLTASFGEEPAQTLTPVVEFDAQELWDASGGAEGSTTYGTIQAAGITMNNCWTGSQNPLGIDETMTGGRPAIRFGFSNSATTEEAERGGFDFTADTVYNESPAAMTDGTYVMEAQMITYLHDGTNNASWIRYELRGGTGADSTIARLRFDLASQEIALVDANDETIGTTVSAAFGQNKPVPGYVKFTVDLDTQTYCAYLALYDDFSGLDSTPTQLIPLAEHYPFLNEVNQLTRLDISGRFPGGGNALAGFDNLKVSKVETEPEPETYTVAANAADETMGSAQVETEGGPFTAGTEVTVSASANAGYVFTGWSAEGITLTSEQQTQNPLTITMPAENVTLTASFRVEGAASITPASASYDKNAAAPAHQAIAVTLDPGEYTLTKIQLQGDPAVELAADTDYTVEETVYTFPTSYLDTLAVGEHTIEFVMSGGSNPALSITVSESDPGEIPYRVTVSAGSGGTARLSGSQTEFLPGDLVTVVATANSGYVFSRWTADGVTLSSATTSTTSFIMPEQAVTVSASFTRQSTGGGGGGRGSSSSAQGGATVVTPSGQGGSAGESEEPQLDDLSSNHFEDVTTDITWAYGYIEHLASAGIVSGDASGNFHPKNAVTREEFLKMLMGALEIDTTVTTGSAFSDVSSSDWCAPYVYTAYELGLVEGQGGGVFGAGQTITRQDMAVMASRAVAAAGKTLPQTEAVSLRDLSQVSGYARASVEQLAAAGILSGDENGFFRPANSALREDAAKIIYLIWTA